MPTKERRKSQMSFPQEVVDTIIDHLQDDKRSLVACAFLGIEWVYRSRNHLFRAITFQAVSKGNRHARFLKLIHSQTQQNVSVVKPFFLDSVRHIRFDQRTQRRGLPLSHPLITSLTCLRKVETLTIAMGGGTISTQTATVLHTAFQSITTFILDDLWFPNNTSPADVIFLLGRFPVLETLRLKVNFGEASDEFRLPVLSLEMGSCVDGGNDEGGFVPLSPYLHTLELDLFPARILYPWLSSSHQSLLNIKHLQLNKIRWDEPKYIGPLLTKLGPHLEELELCLPFHEDFNELFDFHSLVNIRYISIRPSAVDRLEFLSRPLLSLPTLEVAALTFSMHTYDAVRQLLTPHFVHVLEDFGTALKSRKLSFVIFMKTYSECPRYLVGNINTILASDQDAQGKARHAIKKLIEGALPTCVRRGLLDVTVHFEDDPYSKVMGSSSFGALQREYGEPINEQDMAEGRGAQARGRKWH